MKRLIIIIITIISLQSCTSEEDFNKGKQQLESQGYTNVINTGYSSWCCSDSDSYSTGFKATDSKGKEVNGCFCSAVGKGITIRFK